MARERPRHPATSCPKRRRRSFRRRLVAMPELDLSAAGIEAAAEHIPSVFLDSPQFVDERLSNELGRTLVVKVETLNPIGSFKGRGTSLLTRRLDPEREWVCSTAGNFGQGIAYAARERGAGVQIFVSRAVPAGKV